MLQLQKISERTSIDTNRLLGNGSTGDVYEGLTFTQQGHIPVAIKTIQLKTIDNEVTQYLLKCQLQALKLLKTQKNLYVVKLEQIVVLQDVCYIVMEKLNGGTLRDFINAHSKGINESCSFEIITKVIEGYMSLNHNGIIHRDLKPQNIIFRDKNYKQPCIIDFGYCIVPQVTNIPQMYYNVGSPRYMAPQAYKNNKYSEKSDIWAIGVILFEMLFGHTFDQNQKVSECHEKVKKEGVPYPNQFPKETKIFLNLLLAYEEDKRIKFIELFNEIKNFNLYRENKRYRSQSAQMEVPLRSNPSSRKIQSNPSEYKQIPGNDLHPIINNSFRPFKQLFINVQSRDQQPFQQTNKYFINDKNVPKRIIKNQTFHNRLEQSAHHQPFKNIEIQETIKINPTNHQNANKMSQSSYISNPYPASIINMTLSKHNLINQNILNTQSNTNPANNFQFLRHSQKGHNLSQPQVLLKKSLIIPQSEISKPSSDPKMQFKTQQGFRKHQTPQKQPQHLNKWVSVTPINTNYFVPKQLIKIPSNINFIESKNTQSMVEKHQISNFQHHQTPNFKEMNAPFNFHNHQIPRRTILAENSAPLAEYYPQNIINNDLIKRSKLRNPTNEMMKKPFLGASNRFFH